MAVTNVVAHARVTTCRGRDLLRPHLYEVLQRDESTKHLSLISLSSTPAEVARVVVAAARGDALLDGAVFSRLAETRQPVGEEPCAARLTARELEVRDLLAEGLADKQIATRLGISVKTVEKHVGSMLRKTGARNRTTLVTLPQDAAQ